MQLLYFYFLFPHPTTATQFSIKRFCTFYPVTHLWNPSPNTPEQQHLSLDTSNRPLPEINPFNKHHEGQMLVDSNLQQGRCEYKEVTREGNVQANNRTFKMEVGLAWVAAGVNLSQIKPYKMKYILEKCISVGIARNRLLKTQVDEAFVYETFAPPY